MKIIVPIEISARHVHLTQEHVEFLFGKGHVLSSKKSVSQTGQFVCDERVDLVGNDGAMIPHVAIVGPARSKSQVEVAITDAVHLRKKALLAVSGQLHEAESITVRVDDRTLDLPHALMVTKRHIHCPPDVAAAFGLQHLQEVSVRVTGERGLVFDHVVIRVDPLYVWSFQIDTDEGNAAGLKGGEKGEVIV